MKRLPMPASGISMLTSSGVSMLSWSELRSPPTSMTQILSNQWIGKRRPHWDRLASLLAQSDASGLSQLSRAELQEMALLYRQVAADLSVLRQDATSRTYAVHVNQLLARAHHIIYSGRKTSLMTLFLFLRDEYPLIFRAQIGFVLVSLGVSLAFGILGAVMTNARPEFMRHFVGPEMIATMERHEMWTESIVGIEPKATSAIMTNNLMVTFVTFATGIVFGVGTLFYLFINGMLLGVIGAACAQYGDRK